MASVITSDFGATLPDPVYMSRKIRKFRMDKFDTLNKRIFFYSCNSCKRLVPGRINELHESKFTFVSRIEYIRSKLSIFFLMYMGSLIKLYYAYISSMNILVHMM